MSQVTLECHILDTGYCLAWEHHMIQGGQRRKVACHSLVALLKHQEHGWMLWDTGYAPRMLEATQTLPFSLYRRATPLYIQPRLSVAAQLARWQLKPSDIRRIIISHFHADHLAGLRDFPQAELIASGNAYADVATRRGINALRRAFIPALLPTDFAERATLLPEFNGPNLASLGPTYDLFCDGSLRLVSLPGHARGQLGLLAQTQRGQLLFAADSCWLRRSIYECRPPSRLTNFFVDDPRAIRNTIQHLHDFAQAQTDVVIIPSHCPEAFRQEVELSYEDN
ncbi:MBL fold metallo-hydrolase [Ktedonosporobacter rubrisoli]|uniref:MBL fold metallo-hydrolase n=1 Tax=Ktedonosporobacter rubrisoli TaxID=2509675 RepID=A0A4P6JRT1_KTERU|nr:MBL fold metallo-hydrolase [Ktedonosporobacter rubrisoli]QBD77912.1 MBL fold metallo-hydrolase [Ktedonosporobacter rubrisoli]